jgi:hypothetical protein
MFSAVFPNLTECCAQSVVAEVGVEYKRLVEVWAHQDWCGAQGAFQFLEGRFLIVAPSEWDFLFRQIVERFCLG